MVFANLTSDLLMGGDRLNSTAMTLHDYSEKLEDSKWNRKKTMANLFKQLQKQHNLPTFTFLSLAPNMLFIFAVKALQM